MKARVALAEWSAVAWLACAEQDGMAPRLGH
jgi:hypothetical protein